MTSGSGAPAGGREDSHCKRDWARSAARIIEACVKSELFQTRCDVKLPDCMEERSLFAELKRRNVYKVAVAYVVISWLLIQAASILLPTFEAPSWVMKVFVVLLALGFILAVFVSWAFEATPEGLKRTGDVSRDAAA